MTDRIILILPCCIGDVVFATASLMALRRAYPQAHITWAVGGWSAAVLAGHPALDALLDTGPSALPVKSWAGFWRFRHQLAHGAYDVAVSLVRSPLMSAAVWASGIPIRVGLNSGGRGLLYTVRHPIDPDQPQHEVDIYLGALRAWGVDTAGSTPFLAPSDADHEAVTAQLASHHIRDGYLVVNPAGGSNPGMTLESKRYPLPMLAQVVNQLVSDSGRQVVVIGGPGDEALVAALSQRLTASHITLVNMLTLLQLGALAARSWLYIGNDTGLTHVANACGARTVMVMGPTDPVRYGAYGGRSLTLWRPAHVSVRGVAGAPTAWDWQRDGIQPDDAYGAITAFLRE